jgi:hypothetical protein
MATTGLCERGQLVELLERQRVIYERLRTLAERQRGLVLQGDPQSLLAILADRQRLVDDLSQLNARLAPFRRDWVRINARLDDEGRRRVRDAIRASDDILSSILRSDQEDMDSLTGRKHEMRAEMVRTSSGAAASRAYAAAGAGAASLTDAHA